MGKVSRWFKTDLGYQTTIKALGKSPIVVKGYSSDTKPGIYTFKLEGIADFSLQITNTSLFAIHYPGTMNIDKIVEQAKPLLLRPDNTPIKMFEDHYSSKKELKEKDVLQVRSAPRPSENSREANEDMSGREIIRYVLVDGGKGNVYHGVLPGIMYADVRAENTGHLRANYRLAGAKRKMGNLHPK